MTDDRRGVVRHEEELSVETGEVVAGTVRVSKRVDVEPVERRVSRLVEHAAVDRMTVADGDSGRVETLPDGSISIPVLEEELVITKRTVVRERIVIRKETVVESQRIEAELRREHVEVDGAEEADGGDG